MTRLQPLARIRAFFGTMAGQIFLILTLGMSVAAIIALLVAEQARHHDFERVRRARVVASAVDIADRLQRDPARVEAMMANHRIVGAAMAPAGVALSDTDGELCLLYTSPSPRDYAASRMPSSA